eukprot:g3837.t1
MKDEWHYAKLGIRNQKLFGKNVKSDFEKLPKKRGKKNVKKIKIPESDKEEGLKGSLMSATQLDQVNSDAYQKGILSLKPTADGHNQYEIKRLDEPIHRLMVLAWLRTHPPRKKAKQSMEDAFWEWLDSPLTLQKVRDEQIAKDAVAQLVERLQDNGYYTIGDLSSCPLQQYGVSVKMIRCIKRLTGQVRKQASYLSKVTVQKMFKKPTNAAIKVFKEQRKKIDLPGEGEEEEEIELDVDLPSTPNSMIQNVKEEEKEIQKIEKEKVKSSLEEAKNYSLNDEEEIIAESLEAWNSVNNLDDPIDAFLTMTLASIYDPRKEAVNANLDPSHIRNYGFGTIVDNFSAAKDASSIYYRETMDATKNGSKSVEEIADENGKSIPWKKFIATIAKNTTAKRILIKERMTEAFDHGGRYITRLKEQGYGTIRSLSLCPLEEIEIPWRLSAAIRLELVKLRSRKPQLYKPTFDTRYQRHALDPAQNRPGHTDIMGRIGPGARPFGMSTGQRYYERGGNQGKAEPIYASEGNGEEEFRLVHAVQKLKRELQKYYNEISGSFSVGEKISFDNFSKELQDLPLLKTPSEEELLTLFHSYDVDSNDCIHTDQFLSSLQTNIIDVGLGYPDTPKSERVGIRLPQLQKQKKKRNRRRVTMESAYMPKGLRLKRGYRNNKKSASDPTNYGHIDITQTEKMRREVGWKRLALNSDSYHDTLLRRSMQMTDKMRRKVQDRYGTKWASTFAGRLHETQSKQNEDYFSWKALELQWSQKIDRERRKLQDLEEGRSESGERLRSETNRGRSISRRSEISRITEMRGLASRNSSRVSSKRIRDKISRSRAVTRRRADTSRTANSTISQTSRAGTAQTSYMSQGASDSLVDEEELVLSQLTPFWPQELNDVLDEAKSRREAPGKRIEI